MFKRYYKEGGNPMLQYWIDDNGTDWYDYADNAECETMKVLTNEQNIVVGFNQDATTLYPENANLHIISLDQIPKDLDVLKYSYDGDKFYLTAKEVRGQSVEDIKNELFMLMLKTKMTAEEKKQFEELKELLQEKLSK